jgi:hypothetical protein
MQHITIHDETSFPVRYKRVNKPTIFKAIFGIWVCTDREIDGQGYTPDAAYRAWARNHFLGARR